ncbi:vesicle-associated membrane protein 722-like [Oryza brachyantha]|uniref:vesicle-associated membrane protein 722-like n=1 Tax=Oryza brachyantha TaxID=4533 RepID=UPI0003EAA525|nr:vesicle-associated membrane protein 722-like [Oryza brachyantha]
MGESKLIYAMVARGTVVLAEHAAYAGNFRDIAAQCLHKLPAGDNRLTYTCDAHTFNFLIHQGYAYCVVATESTGRQIPLALLDMIKDDFNKRYAGGKAATAAANSLSRDFGPKLGEQMQYCMDHPEEVSKLAKVKAQVSEVKGIMMENIEKAIDRGQQIDVLVTRTEQLHDQAADFRQQGTRVRRKMWYQNMKIKLIVLGIIIALILIIILSVCRGFKC